MSSNYDFQKELEKSIFKADVKLNRKELLTSIFKTYVAEFFKFTLERKENKKERLEFDALVDTKKNLINEFRKASLGEYQMSIKQYEDLFDITVKEITNFAGLRHGGQENISMDHNLSINKQSYDKSHIVTKSGIMIPNNN